MPVSPDPAPDAGEEGPVRQPETPSKPTLVETGPEGELLWESLCETWLTQRVVARGDTHVKGGYAWETSSYLPVFLTDEDGDPVLAFARR